MKKTFGAIKLVIVAIVVMGMPLAAMAQIPPAPIVPGAPVTTVAGAVGIANTILQWVYTIFFAVAGLMLVWAAFTYITAQGSEEKINKAKTMLIYGIIGIAVALVAFGVDSFVANLIGGGTVVP